MAYLTCFQLLGLCRVLWKGWLINEELIRNFVEGCSSDLILKYYREIILEGLTKTTKISIRDRRFPNRGLKLVPDGYEYQLRGRDARIRPSVVFLRKD
jgi:hypothetical protein